MVVLEDMERAQARGQKSMPRLSAMVRTLMVRYGCAFGEGAVRCMELALAGFDGNGIRFCRLHQCPRHLDTIGDISELNAVREVFGKRGYLPILPREIPDGAFAWCDGVRNLIRC